MLNNRESLKNRKRINESEKARDAFAICKGLAIALEEAEDLLSDLDHNSKECEVALVLYDRLNERFYDSYKIVKNHSIRQLEDFFE